MSATLNGDSEYAKRRQAHVKLINRLRAIGAQTELDLPRVVVIGNQSAGKSSLVEAISGITVPRDAGTCTRCPIECRMFEGPQWTCQISIRLQFAADGSKLKNIKEVPFGGPIANKAEVEFMLRRAQVAALNPTRDPREYLDMNIEHIKSFGQTEKHFSRNSVCVNLRDPDMTALAFIDLPGIVQNADNNVVDMVEQLVSDYIGGNSIILVTLPMSDDIENQKAMQLAKKADPDGLRTIGVLTKPDAMSAGSTKAKELWLDVIEGRRHPLKLGYFCTRQPDEDERANGLTQEGARQAESNFFNSTAPWSHHVKQYPERFGTRNLVSAISVQLARIIDDSLPGLVDETSRLLVSCDARLSKLTPVTTEPFSFILNLVQLLSMKIRSYVHGDFGATGLITDNRKVLDDFKTWIRMTAPLFVPYTDDDAARISAIPLELRQLEEGECLYPEVPKEKYITISQVQARIKGATTRELPNNVPYVVKLLLIEDFQKTWRKIVNDSEEKIVNIFKGYVNSAVKELFKDHKHLYRHAQNAVGSLLLQKHDSMVAQTSKILKYESTAYAHNGRALQEAKDRFTAMYRRIREKPVYTTPGTREILFPWTYLIAEDTDTSVKLVQLQTICNPLHSLQSWSHEEVRFGDYQQRAQPFLFGLRQAAPNNEVALRQPQAAAPPIPSPEQDRHMQQQIVLAALQKLGINGVRAEDLQKLNPSNRYEEELALMGEVRAYFKIAYNRMVDYIAMAIDQELLHAFADELYSHMISALGLNPSTAAAKCAEYLAEDSHIVAEREELLARKDRLLDIQKELKAAA